MSAPTSKDHDLLPPEPLFRQEAMHEYARGRLEGKLLRISPRWTEWVFRLLLATFVGAAAFLFWAKIDHVVSGPAVVRRVADAGGQPTLEIIALLPGNTRAQLREGQAMSVRWSGAALSSLPLQVEKIAADIVGPDRARELLGAELSGILQVQGPVVFVSAALPALTSSTALVPGNSGVAEVRIGRHRLYEELFSGAAR